MDFLPQVIVQGLLGGASLALVAVGLTLIFGVVDIVNFAHGEFVMVGLYTSLIAWTALGLDPLVSLPLAAIAVGALGLISYIVFVRHAMRGTLLSQIFVTWGMLILFRGLAQYFFGSDFERITTAFLTDIRWNVAGVIIPANKAAAAVGSLLGTGAVGWFVWRTRTGKALMATSQDREAASLMGINDHRMFALAWLVGGAATGFAAGLLAAFQPIHPDAGVAFGLTAFIIVALGGFGSIGGALIAALIVGMLENVAGFYINPSLREVWPFALFLVVLIARPQGLLGKR